VSENDRFIVEDNMNNNLRPITIIFRVTVFE